MATLRTKPGHSRKAKPVVDPRTRKVVRGVSLHPNGGYYVWDCTNSPAKRKYFGKTLPGLDRAIAFRRRIDNLSMFLYDARDPEVIRQEVIDNLYAAGIHGDEYLDNNPEHFQEAIQQRTVKISERRINPKFEAAHPEEVQKFKDERLARLLRMDLDEFYRWRNRPSSEDTDNPHGERFTLQRALDEYIDWYASERGKGQAEREAEIHNRKAREHNDNIERLIDAGEKPNSGKRWIRKPYRTWTTLMRRTHKQNINETQKMVGEFIAFINDQYPDVPYCDQLKGEHFKTYRAHVYKTADRRARKGQITDNPINWRNKRFGCVTKVINKAVALNRDAAWPRGFFGENNYLTLLEKQSEEEGAKTLITPDEFAVMLAYSDTQFKAMTCLALNCALNNQDCCDIEWKHVALDNQLMVFPRGKTKQKRITPLLPATINALQAWRKETKSRLPFIFMTPLGEPWVSNGICDRWAATTRQIEQERDVKIPATFRALRKTAASTAMDQLNNESQVETLMGHRSNRALRYYWNQAPDYLYEAVEAIGRKFPAADSIG